jgi:hypothetical protein
MTMRVGEIMIWRDGGTITFTIDGCDRAGKYRLQTPVAGEPRPLFRDDTQFAIGGADEAKLLAGLRDWLSATATADAHGALARLDAMREWRNFPDDLDRVVPLHRIRSVIRCLEARAD